MIESAVFDMVRKGQICGGNAVAVTAKKVVSAYQTRLRGRGF